MYFYRLEENYWKLIFSIYNSIKNYKIIKDESNKRHVHWKAGLSAEKIQRGHRQMEREMERQLDPGLEGSVSRCQSTPN